MSIWSVVPVVLFMEAEFLLPSGGRSRMPRHASETAEVARSGERRQNYDGKERPKMHLCGLTILTHCLTSTARVFQPSLENFHSFISLTHPVFSSQQFLFYHPTRQVPCLIDIHIDVPSLSILKESYTAKSPNGIMLHARLQLYSDPRGRWSPTHSNSKYLGRGT
jgi:hypothetical protein